MNKRIFVLIFFIFLSINVYASDALSNVKVNNQAMTCSQLECTIRTDAKDLTFNFTVNDGWEVLDSQSKCHNGGTLSKRANTEDFSCYVTTKNKDTGDNQVWNFFVPAYEKSTNNKIKGITINGESLELDPAKQNADTGTIAYQTTVKYNISEIKIGVSCEDSKCKTNAGTYSFPLEDSSKSIDFSVTAEDGVTTTKYHIQVYRGSKPDTSLKVLSIEDITFDFKPEVFDYEVTVPYKITQLNIKTEANAQSAKVDVKKSDLVVGENTVTITVTNTDVSSVYTIKVTRFEDVDVKLSYIKNIKLNDKEFKFKEDTFEYILESYDLDTKYDIKIEDNEDCTHKITDEKVEDYREIKIVSSYKDNMVTSTYIIKVYLKEKKELNKTIILIMMITIGVIMIILFILEIKRRKFKKQQEELNKIIEENNKDNDIELI